MLSSIAVRVHRMDAMAAFYAGAFGVRFTPVQTGPITSRRGQLGPLTLTFVPIRDGVDFEGFPVHQLGLDVGAGLPRILELVATHGGAVLDPPRQVDGRTHAAVRDPDGNTLELYAD